MSNLADKLELAQSTQTEGGDQATALTLFDMVARKQDDVARALPAGMDAGRFVRMMLTEMRRTPKLALCDPATLLGAMMLAAQTGLEPGGPLGQAFLIPRWSNKRKALEAQFQIGYKGLIQLAGRAGFLVQAHTVHDGDDFDYQYGTDEWVWHKPKPSNDGEAIWWWAIAHPVAGGRSPFRVIDRNVAEQARHAGKAGENGPWVTHYDRMAEKTGIIRLTNTLPLTTDVAYAIAADGAVVEEGTSVEAAAELVPEVEPADAADPTADPEPVAAPPTEDGDPK